MKILLPLCGMLILLLSACGSVSNGTQPNDMYAIQTAAYQTAFAIVNMSATAGAPTETPKPTRTPVPSPTRTMLSTNTPQALEGPNISYDGISFNADPILGNEVFMNVMNESPPFTVFSFAPDGDCREIGCVRVYQVEEFRKYPFGDTIMDELQSAIATGSTRYFPTWGGAGILLRAQTQHVGFQNGTGIRAIVERAQKGFFANNEALVYDFHGLTEDGQHYVEVVYPIDAPILLSTYDPAENTNREAISVQVLPDPNDDPYGLLLDVIMREYNQEAQRQLDILRGSRFTPDLELLDDLVGSLLVNSSSGE